MRLIKFKRPDFIYPEFGVLQDEYVRPIKNKYTVHEIFQAIKNNQLQFSKKITLKNIIPLPPIDENSHIYCTGLNYKNLAKELKIRIPDNPIFFSKSLGTIAGAKDQIIYPELTNLLDYEIELAIIIGKKITYDISITDKNLSDFIFGITILNDITARDLQMRSGQWFLGKNFRTFAPIGPYVQIYDDEVQERIYNLKLDLQVYTEDMVPYPDKVQRDNTKNMIFKIHELINCLKTQIDLNPGDIISTGTPPGIASSLLKLQVSKISNFFNTPNKKIIEKYINSEIKNNKRYLQENDIILSKIYSKDHVIDLGVQKNKVVGRLKR